MKKDLAKDIAQLKKNDRLHFERHLELEFLNNSKRAQSFAVHDVIEAILEYLNVEAVVSPEKVTLRKDTMDMESK
jgi:hypothetical protein